MEKGKMMEELMKKDIEELRQILITSIQESDDTIPYSKFFSNKIFLKY